MIVSQCDVHHRSRKDLVADDHRSLLDRVHAENGALRRVQDRRRHHRTENSTVRNRERTPGKLVHADRAILRFHRQNAKLALEVGEAHLIDVAQHRHHQAAFGRYGDADVVVVVIDDVSPFDRCIDDGKPL